MNYTPAHEMTETVREEIEYPEHVERKPSAEFLRNRRLLVTQLDLPCWICGSRDAREVHHIHEWSLWNCLDLEKVLDTLHVFDPYGYTHKMGEQPITSPDDVRNCLVLCGHCEIDGVSVPGGHHRGVDAGVHRLTFEIWVAQRSAKPGITITKALSR